MGFRFSTNQLLACVFWIAIASGCAAFFLRPRLEDLGPADDTRAAIDAVARLGAFVACGACIGSGIGALTRRQLWFAIGGALMGPAIVVANVAFRFVR